MLSMPLGATTKGGFGLLFGFLMPYFLFVLFSFFSSYTFSSEECSNAYYEVGRNGIVGQGSSPSSAFRSYVSNLSSPLYYCDSSPSGDGSVVILYDSDDKCDDNFGITASYVEEPTKCECPVGLQRLTVSYIETRDPVNDTITVDDSVTVVDDCVYTSTGVGLEEGYDDLAQPDDNWPECHKVEGGGENDVKCTVTSVFRGEGVTLEEYNSSNGQSGSSDEPTVLDGAPEDAFQDLGLEEDVVTDTTISNTETTVSDPVSETLPDGSTVTSTTEQTTQTAGDGVKVTEDSSTVTTTNSDGITKTVTTTTTITRNPDGTSTETIRENVTFSNAPLTTCQSGLNLNGERYLYCSGTGSSQNGSTSTKTTTKDSDGNIVDQTSDSSSECETKEGLDINCDGDSDGGMDGDGDGDTDNQSCDPSLDPSQCQGDEDDPDPWSPPSLDSGVFDIQTLDSDISTAKEELANILDSVSSEASDLVDVSLSGSSSLPSFPLKLGSFGSFTIDLSTYQSELSPIKYAVIFVATVGAVLILLGSGRRS